jgi:hypothetical protein
MHIFSLRDHCGYVRMGYFSELIFECNHPFLFKAKEVKIS